MLSTRASFAALLTVPILACNFVSVPDGQLLEADDSDTVFDDVSESDSFDASEISDGDVTDATGADVEDTAVGGDSDSAVSDAADTTDTDAVDIMPSDATDTATDDTSGTGDSASPDVADSEQPDAFDAHDGSDAAPDAATEDADSGVGGDTDSCALNPCGGCTPLPALGTSCGPCSLDEYVCSDIDAVVCDGATACPLAVLGSSCAGDADCASGSCSEESDGTEFDRCVPRLFDGTTSQIDFSYVPGGSFTMGSPGGEVGYRASDEAQVEVTLSRPLAVMGTEVTQGQWKRATGSMNPSSFSACGDNCPVEQVDWYSAAAYANWLSESDGDPNTSPCYAFTPSTCADTVSDWADGDTVCTGASFAGVSCTGYRLPTEAEWEYAARAGTATATYWNGATSRPTGGNLRSPYACDPQPNLEPVAWYCRNAGASTQAVGLLAANVWGLHDMLGNVWEWTTDWQAPSMPGGIDPLSTLDSGYRIGRGGAWDRDAGYVRAACRSWYDPAGRGPNVGFRVVRSLPIGAASLPLGAACASDSECASGSCSDESAGGEYDRCVPRLFAGVASQMDFAYIPAGSFRMGSPLDEVGYRRSDEAQVDVTLSRSLAVSSTEVTQGQWTRATGATNPTALPDCGYTCPVDSVDWYSAAAYANWLSENDGDPGTSVCYAFTPTSCADNTADWADGDTDCTGATFLGPACTGYRLLTEAEWEYAARAGTVTATYWNAVSGTPTGGNLQAPYDCEPQPNLQSIAWYCWNATSGQQPVGGLAPNAWGLYDMLGNVWEWTSDWYVTNLPGGLDPVASAGSGNRSARGETAGSSAGRVRAAYRGKATPDTRAVYLGFRVARSLP